MSKKITRKQISQKYYEAQALSESGAVNKTAFSMKYGISPRTLGRILQQFPEEKKPTEAETKQCKFSVGDRVTITDVPNQFNPRWGGAGYFAGAEDYEGTSGVVVQTKYKPSVSRYVVEVKLDEDGAHWWFCEDMMEAEKQEQEQESATVGAYVPKVGDIVVGTSKGVYAFTGEGSVCEVVKVFEGGPLLGSIVVKAKVSAPKEGYVGETFAVSAEHFTKIGEVSEVGVAEEVEPVTPVAPPQTAHYTITEMAVALTYNGKVQTVDFTHPMFSVVRQLILEGAYAEASEKMDIKTAIEGYSGGRIQIKDQQVYFDGRLISNGLTNKIIDLMGEGDEGFKGFVKFFEKVMECPSNQTRNRLMEFVAAEDIGLDTDGNIVAFRNVNSDYTPSRVGRWERDFTTGAWGYNASKYYNNTVGSICEMPRSEVDDNHDNQCSHGLHICSVGYLKAFWGVKGRTVKVTVDPRDVCAVPYDYNNSKARVCKFKVIEDVTESLDKYLKLVK